MGIMSDNKEKMLTALSKVPIALTSQLALLLPNYAHPEKEASRLLNQLLQDGLVEGNYHGQQRIWRLTKAGRKLKNVKGRILKNIDHSLEVGDLFFRFQPKRFLFEPTHRFTHLGKEMVFEPDAVMFGERDGERYFWVVEIQRTPIPSKRYEVKWNNFNLFFNNDYWEKAQFQEWFKKPAFPGKFIIITNQQPETVKTGFNVKGKTLDIRATL